MDFKVAYRVPNRIDAPELKDAALLGEIGRRVDKFVEGRVTGDFARNEVLREADEAFRDQTDDMYSFGYWKGEFWGKLVIGAVRVCRMKQDEEFKGFLKEAVYHLLSYQREDGYLNTYKDSRNMFRADPEVTIKEVGWECTFNWNVWSRKYTLWALLEAAQLLDDPHVLDCADRMASQLLDELEDMGVRMKDVGVTSGLPTCSIMKPLLILYRLTGKQRYLDFCLDMAKEWEREDGECPNLLVNVYRDEPMIFWYGVTHGKVPMSDREYDEEWSGKCYELMSCYEGLIELYRVTGVEKYFAATERLYEILIKYESNILGSVGYNEHFDNSAAYPDASTEICDVIHWMRLNYELFRMTGKAKYMQSFERAFVNAFLAGMYEDGRYGSFFVRSAGRHWDAVPQCDTKYQNCCLNNVPRGFVNAAESVAMADETGYYVNLYVPAKVRVGGAEIAVGEGYFTDGKVRVTVSGETAGKKLRLRVPDWSKQTAIAFGGAVVKAAAGEYAELCLADGENTVDLTFDMTARIYDYKGEVRDLPENDYHVKRWLGEGAVINTRDVMCRHAMSTVEVGPLVLARSKRIGSDEKAMFSQETVWGKDYTARAVPVGGEELLSAFDVTFEKDGKTFAYRMCDFASAANLYLEDNHYFTVFV